MFLSHGDLTADDTSASGASQVFRYDAQEGVLTRVSVGMEGFGDDGNRSTGTPCSVTGEECSEDARVVRGTRASRSDPSMSDDGSRVFFESPVGLTVHALNDVQIGLNAENNPRYAENVYEWELEGVGSCPVGLAAGCVFLISDGHDVSANNGGSALCTFSSTCLMGADSSGDNVFFTTTDQLVPADTNTELDYYDARVCEPEAGNPCVQSPGAPAAACSGEECHGVLAGPPGVPATPSASFNGTGNIVPAPPVVVKPLSRHERLVKALKSCRVKHPYSRSRRAACERVAERDFGVKAKGKKAGRAARAVRSGRAGSVSGERRGK